MKNDRWWHYASGRIEESNESCSLMVRDDGLKLYVAKVGASEEEMEAVARLFSLAHDLLAECEKMLEFMEHAPFDFSNGVEHMGIDEGEVVGWRAHKELTTGLRETIARTKGKSDES